MPIHKKNGTSTTRLQYKILLAYCLMSVMPILVGIYVASLFIRYPFENTANLPIVTWVTVFSLVLSFLGFKITRQSTQPITDFADAAKKIASGNLESGMGFSDAKGIDELDELSDSLKTISKNARELIEKVEKLSLKDNLTGLYNASYLRERLAEEIQRAFHYQQPCSLVFFTVQPFQELVAKHGETRSHEVLKDIANILSKNVSPLDRAARVGKNEFALILPDKNKKKSIEIAEKIQKQIDSLRRSGQEGAENPIFETAAGISENPMDGASAEELLQKARDRVSSAKSKGPQQIEAFS